LSDIDKAINSLESLGQDLKIIESGSLRVIVSNSVEFNSDQMIILKSAEENGGWITFSHLKAKDQNFGLKDRFKKAID